MYSKNDELHSDDGYPLLSLNGSGCNTSIIGIRASERGAGILKLCMSPVASINRNLMVGGSLSE